MSILDWNRNERAKIGLFKWLTYLCLKQSTLIRLWVHPDGRIMHDYPKKLNTQVLLSIHGWNLHNGLKKGESESAYYLLNLKTGRVYGSWLRNDNDGVTEISKIFVYTEPFTSSFIIYLLRTLSKQGTPKYFQEIVLINPVGERITALKEEENGLINA